MAAALKQNHIFHRIIILEGLGHIFDIAPDTSLEGASAGLNHPKVAEAFEAVLAFLAPTDEQVQTREANILSLNEFFQGRK